MSATDTTALPDYPPVPRPAPGPALNEQGYYVGRVEQNLYWITGGACRSAFLTSPAGAVLLDAPPTIGNKIQRAVDETDRDLLLENNLVTAIANPTAREFLRNADPILARGSIRIPASARARGSASSPRSTPSGR